MLIEKQSNGYERHYLKFTQNGQLAGLALFNVDYTAANEFRGYIRHISTLNMETLASAVELTINFIWKNMFCQNIRIELFHIKDETT